LSAKRLNRHKGLLFWRDCCIVFVLLCTLIYQVDQALNKSVLYYNMDESRISPARAEGTEQTNETETHKNVISEVQTGKLIVSRYKKSLSQAEVMMRTFNELQSTMIDFDSIGPNDSAAIKEFTAPSMHAGDKMKRKFFTTSNGAMYPYGVYKKEGVFGLYIGERVRLGHRDIGFDEGHSAFRVVFAGEKLTKDDTQAYVIGPRSDNLCKIDVVYDKTTSTARADETICGVHSIGNISDFSEPSDAVEAFCDAAEEMYSEVWDGDLQTVDRERVLGIIRNQVKSAIVISISTGTHGTIVLPPPNEHGAAKYNSADMTNDQLLGIDQITQSALMFTTAASPEEYRANSRANMFNHSLNLASSMQATLETQIENDGMSIEDISFTINDAVSVLIPLPHKQYTARSTYNYCPLSLYMSTCNQNIKSDLAAKFLTIACGEASLIFDELKRRYLDTDAQILNGKAYSVSGPDSVVFYKDNPAHISSVYGYRRYIRVADATTKGVCIEGLASIERRAQTYDVKTDYIHTTSKQDIYEIGSKYNKAVDILNESGALSIGGVSLGNTFDDIASKGQDIWVSTSLSEGLEKGADDMTDGSYSNKVNSLLFLLAAEFDGAFVDSANNKSEYDMYALQTKERSMNTGVKERQLTRLATFIPVDKTGGWDNYRDWSLAVVFTSVIQDPADVDEGMQQRIDTLLQDPIKFPSFQHEIEGNAADVRQTAKSALELKAQSVLSDPEQKPVLDYFSAFYNSLLESMGIQDRLGINKKTLVATFMVFVAIQESKREVKWNNHEFPSFLNLTQTQVLCERLDHLLTSISLNFVQEKFGRDGDRRYIFGEDYNNPDSVILSESVDPILIADPMLFGDDTNSDNFVDDDLYKNQLAQCIQRILDWDELDTDQKRAVDKARSSGVVIQTAMQDYGDSVSTFKENLRRLTLILSKLDGRKLTEDVVLTLKYHVMCNQISSALVTKEARRILSRDELRMSRDIVLSGTRYKMFAPSDAQLTFNSLSHALQMVAQYAAYDDFSTNQECFSQISSGPVAVIQKQHLDAQDQFLVMLGNICMTLVEQFDYRDNLYRSGNVSKIIGDCMDLPHPTVNPSLNTQQDSVGWLAHVLECPLPAAHAYQKRSSADFLSVIIMHAFAEDFDETLGTAALMRFLTEDPVNTHYSRFKDEQFIKSMLVDHLSGRLDPGRVEKVSDEVSQEIVKNQGNTEPIYVPSKGQKTVDTVVCKKQRLEETIKSVYYIDVPPVLVSKTAEEVKKIVHRILYCFAESSDAYEMENARADLNMTIPDFSDCVIAIWSNIHLLYKDRSAEEGVNDIQVVVKALKGESEDKRFLKAVEELKIAKGIEEGTDVFETFRQLDIDSWTDTMFFDNLEKLSPIKNKTNTRVSSKIYRLAMYSSATIFSYVCRAFWAILFSEKEALPVLETHMRCLFPRILGKEKPFTSSNIVRCLVKFTPWETSKEHPETIATNLKVFSHGSLALSQKYIERDIHNCMAGVITTGNKDELITHNVLGASKMAYMFAEAVASPQDIVSRVFRGGWVYNPQEDVTSSIPNVVLSMIADSERVTELKSYVSGELVEQAANGKAITVRDVVREFAENYNFHSAEVFTLHDLRRRDSLIMHLTKMSVSDCIDAALEEYEFDQTRVSELTEAKLAAEFDVSEYTRQTELDAREEERFDALEFNSKRAFKTTGARIALYKVYCEMYLIPLCKKLMENISHENAAHNLKCQMRLAQACLSELNTVSVTAQIAAIADNDSNHGLSSPRFQCFTISGIQSAISSVTSESSSLVPILSTLAKTKSASPALKTQYHINGVSIVPEDNEPHTKIVDGDYEDQSWNDTCVGLYRIFFARLRNDLDTDHVFSSKRLMRYADKSVIASSIVMIARLLDGAKVLAQPSPDMNKSDTLYSTLQNIRMNTIEKVTGQKERSTIINIWNSLQTAAAISLLEMPEMTLPVYMSNYRNNMDTVLHYSQRMTSTEKLSEIFGKEVVVTEVKMAASDVTEDIRVRPFAPKNRLAMIDRSVMCNIADGPVPVFSVASIDPGHPTLGDINPLKSDGASAVVSPTLKTDDGSFPLYANCPQNKVLSDYIKVMVKRMLDDQKPRIIERTEINRLFRNRDSIILGEESWALISGIDGVINSMPANLKAAQTYPMTLFFSLEDTEEYAQIIPPRLVILGHADILNALQVFDNPNVVSRVTRIIDTDRGSFCDSNLEDATDFDDMMLIVASDCGELTIEEQNTIKAYLKRNVWAITQLTMSEMYEATAGKESRMLLVCSKYTTNTTKTLSIVLNHDSATEENTNSNGADSLMSTPMMLSTVIAGSAQYMENYRRATKKAYIDHIKSMFHQEKLEGEAVELVAHLQSTIACALYKAEKGKGSIAPVNFTSKLSINDIFNVPFSQSREGGELNRKYIGHYSEARHRLTKSSDYVNSATKHLFGEISPQNLSVMLLADRITLDDKYFKTKSREAVSIVNTLKLRLKPIRDVVNGEVIFLGTQFFSTRTRISGYKQRK
jgi:hypothetical protein